MPRPRCRPSVNEDDYQDVAEDLGIDLLAHERAVEAFNVGRPALQGGHGPSNQDHCH